MFYRIERGEAEESRKKPATLKQVAAFKKVRGKGTI